ncbi:MAG: hypothetical protein MZV63_63165 [Marinilabiliales bacterium]|nr:hypothetical protein [Marinilabiliales bacterium]
MIGDGLGEIAVGDPDRAVDEPVDGPGDAPGQEGRPGDAEEEAADADEQEDLLDLPQPGVHRLERQADLDRAPAARPLEVEEGASTSRTRIGSALQDQTLRLRRDCPPGSWRRRAGWSEASSPCDRIVGVRRPRAGPSRS